MAEIRKHNPEAGNAIAQALRAAMGEPVRPNEPGAAPRPLPSADGAPTVKVVSVHLETRAADPEEPDDEG